jgi:hypothetical protein
LYSVGVSGAVFRIVRIANSTAVFFSSWSRNASSLARVGSSITPAASFT